MTDPSQQVASRRRAGEPGRGDGQRRLANDDIAAAARPSAHQDDWERRYSDDPQWSGDPGGTLVAEIAGLDPGRALNVGAGEVGDARWLAEQGWTVTATDISQRALERIATLADAQHLPIVCRHVDADAHGAFEAGAFDLVTSQYASIHRTPDGRGIANLPDAARPAARCS